MIQASSSLHMGCRHENAYGAAFQPAERSLSQTYVAAVAATGAAYMADTDIAHPEMPIGNVTARTATRAKKYAN
jgi:hypothetical protein